MTADANNHLQGGYTYDAAGNMLHDTTSGWNYTYDQESRITGAAGYTYTYDGDGNRVEKSNGSTGTLYWYMSPGIVAESDLSGNLTSEYVFFDGERVARKDFPGLAVSYYFSDHLKTTDIVTDASGNIKNESDFYPWGGELEFLANDSNHYKFTGKERDSETGLDYFGARYYSNGLGRFITPDWAAKATAVPYAEFADPQSLNLYSYVRDIPTVRVDSDGHCCEVEFATWFGNAAARDGGVGAAAENVGVGAAKGTGAFVYHTLMSSNPITMAVDHLVGEPTTLQASNQTQTDAKVATIVVETIATVLLPGPKGAASEGDAVGAGARLPQDINVNPRPPAANNGNGTVGPSASQNSAAQSDAASAAASGHTDIRMNQQQVDANGNRVGTNRPDLQSTDANGMRHYTEYDRSAQSAADHHARTTANDSNGQTHTKIIK